MRVRVRLRRLATQYGLQAGIIAVGAALAAGQVGQSAYLTRTPVVQSVMERAKSPRFAVGRLGTAESGNLAELDAGMEHPTIAKWVTKLASAPGFDRLLEKKAQYEPMITAKLDAKQMPRDLIYLAMIESEFNPNAKSRVKAVGMWQFMAPTARQFGLKVRGKVDERRDPELATEAALTYLASLKERFGSWYLAAAAYNSGAGTVRSALRRTTGRTTGTDADFFRIMPKLPKETRDYVPKLIAAARVGNDP
ncbi:MAG TPA: lytic transglycosylase domain-containing protein, partial [Gemmatimonadaceae bacterium]